MPQTIPNAETTTTVSEIQLALDLGGSGWKLAFGDGKRHRFRSISAWDLDRLEREVAQSKKHFGLSDDAPVVSCHEAGRDGFSVHRALEQRGITSIVVDSASIEQNRRKRQVKTDKIDARKLLDKLRRYRGGETTVWAVVRVPSTSAEDARQLHRQRDALKKYKSQHSNRIRSLLAAQGVKLSDKELVNLPDVIDALRTRTGQPLGEQLKRMLLMEHAHLALTLSQLAEIDKMRREMLKAPDPPEPLRKVNDLLLLRSLGMQTSWSLVMELFGWRQFDNRRQLGSASGLSPTPWRSDGIQREQGISKAGNPRVRAMMVELSWLWLRYQPQSALSRWFQRRFANGGSKARRVGIVALARKLLIALWHYVEHGVVPDGAIMR